MVASNYAVEAFDRMLDEKMELIEAAAERLARESLMAQAEKLGVALSMDLIGADDFR